MTKELTKLRDALRRVKNEAASLADAQVIALEALTAAQSAQVPEGWKLVPVEPTVEMALAGADVIRNRARGKFVRYVMHDVWAAMLAAAPQGADHG